MTGIHILKGRGNNCTCNDCGVLYTGDDADCYTTPMNDMLDEMELWVQKNITEKNKNYSFYQLKKAVSHIRKEISKYEKITIRAVLEHYQAFAVLFFMGARLTEKERDTSDYRWARQIAYWNAISTLKKWEENKDKEED